MLVTYFVNFRLLNDHLFGKELFILFAASAFRKLSSIYVFSYFPFGFEGRIWDLIVSVPDHCLSFYFLHYKSTGKKNPAQEGITRKWIIRSGPNLNTFELLCLSSLPAGLTKIQSMTEKSWRHNLFQRSRACNSKMIDQIWPKFELVQDVMPVLVTWKFDEDWVHSNWEKMETPFSPFKVNGNAQRRITP